MWITFPIVEKSEDISQVFVAILSDSLSTYVITVSQLQWVDTKISIKLMKFIENCTVDQIHLYQQKSIKFVDKRLASKTAFPGHLKSLAVQILLNDGATNPLSSTVYQ